MKQKNRIKDALSLWNEMVTIGKIDLKHYDTEIESNILNELNIKASSLNSALKNEAISVEDLITAFFVVVQPFSMMMSEILSFFEEFAIKSTNDNLDIELDFGKDFSQLQFDVNAFKNWVTQWRNIESIIVTVEWDSENLWNLNGVLRSNSIKDKHPELSEWERMYEDDLTWPDFYPPFPISVPEELEPAFKRAFKIFKLVQDESKAFHTDRQQFWKMRWSSTQNQSENLTEDNGSLNILAGIDHDRWASSFINGLYSKAKEYYQIEPNRREAFAQSLKKDLDQVFNNTNQTIKTIHEQVEDILEFLDLPIWKQRHELYSVWVGIKTLNVIKEKYPIRVHSVDQKLVFSFSGTHVATVDQLLPNLHFWSELRSPLSNPVGKYRKKAIQPDYSLLKDPVSSPKSSILEIECKQYKKASKNNFISALIDYAKGRPNAQIVLVNYGVISDSIQNAIPNEIFDRALMIGNLNPRFQKQINLFKSIILDSINKNYLGYQSNVSTQPKSSPFDQENKSIEMIWEKGAMDLDLHLLFKDKQATFEINYNNKGTFNKHPFLLLNKDILDGNGTETITINKWLTGKYYVSVHNYSKDSSLKESEVQLRMGNEIYRIENATGNAGDWWHVIEIDTLTGQVFVLNEINDHSIAEFAK